MSSAIGNYVHYSAKGYLNHGTNKTGPFSMWKTQTEEIKAKAKKNSATLGRYDYDKISQALEGIMKSDPGDSGAEALAMNQVIQFLDNKYKDTMQSLDTKTGNVSLKSTDGIIGQLRSSTSIEAALKKAVKLESILLDSAKSGSVEAQEAIKNVNQLIAFYDEIAKDINGMKKRNQLKITSQPETKKNLMEKKKELNQLIHEYAAYPAIELQKGDFFEALASHLPDVCEDIVGAEIQGDLREQVNFNRDVFEDQLITKEFGDMLERTSFSQGKVDVEITWKGQDEINQILGASLKNANLNKYYVHILSDSSLLYMIQDLDADFVNHFLNLFAKHKDAKKRTSTFQNLRSQMLEEMRLILFYKGLSGDNYGRKAANLFIVNDNQTGRVRTFGINELIDKVSENLNSLRGIQANHKTFNEAISFTNDWGTTPEERISRVLASVHATKISASISTGLLK